MADIRKDLDAKNQTQKKGQAVVGEDDTAPGTIAIYYALNPLDDFENSYPYEDLSAKRHEFSKELSDLENLRAQYNDNKDRATVAAQRSQTSAYIQLSLGISALLAKIEAYKVYLFANSIAIRYRKKKEYEHATYFGYALFGLGLVVSVLPKLFGSEEGEAPESDIFDLVS